MHAFYNAHHAAIGAFASFTLGYRGAKGGLGLELGRPANENVWIGLESADAENVYECLPFFKEAEDQTARFDVEAASGKGGPAARIAAFADGAVSRDFRVATDTWHAGDLTFRIVSPVLPVPDPEEGDEAALKFALCPAVLAELTVDNSRGARPRRAVFGYQGSDPYGAMHRLDGLADDGWAGIGQVGRTAIATDADDMEACQHFTLEAILDPANVHNRYFGLGGAACLLGAVPAGETRTWRFAACFYRDGAATSGLETTYWYTGYFDDIEAVARYALGHFEDYLAAADDANADLAAADLTDDQRWMLAHAVRSYYGSTQLLDVDGVPYWVVNEGEYRMMNTFDLTVDQVFHEMRMHPWTVRNELDWFVRRYSYRDRARLPGDETEHPGGISFTHDQGIACAFSRPGTSSYECFGLDGCFSHMTHEQLVNWVLCGAVYEAHTKDAAWRDHALPTFEACLESLVHRDHPDPAERDGVMSLDSSRVRGGAEITTYDSLDASLGQARNNLYLAVKTWAAYVCLARILDEAGQADRAALAAEQAERCAATVCSKQADDGTLPAVFEAGNQARIIPAIEGLAYAWKGGCPEAVDPDGPFAELVGVLKTHLAAVLTPGVCLFEDGGWKLSSTADNSWLSKIYLCQFVARRLLGLEWDEKGRAADAAHVGWLLHPVESYHAWSDQMVCGVARGSKYYPRGVTAVLWLEE